MLTNKKTINGVLREHENDQHTGENASSIEILEKSGFVVSSMGKIVEKEGFGKELEARVSKYVFSIPDIKEDRLILIKQAILADYLWGKFQGKGGLNRELQRVAGVSADRAKLIALDQNAKISGVMNQLRQTSAGAVGYQWHNVKDQRVRGNPNGKYPNAKFDHWTREGKYFLWEPSAKPPIAPDGKPFRQPPKDGHPGQAGDACRCFPHPVWAD